MKALHLPVALLALGLTSFSLAADRYILINGVASRTIGRYDIQTNQFAMFIDIRPQGGGGNAFTVARNGNILVAADTGVGKILEYNGLTGAFVRSIGTTDAVPHGIAQDADGNILVGSHATNSIKKYNWTTGAFMQTIVSTGQLGLNGCRDLRYNASGDLFYVGAQSETIYKIPNGGSPTVFASLPGDSSCVDFGFDGNVYGVGLWNSDVKKYNAAGVQIGTFAGGLQRPRGLTFNEWNGTQSLFVNESSTNNVYRYSTTGTLLSTFNTIPAGVSDLSFMRSYTPVPEPMSLSFMALGLLGVLRKRKSA